MSNEIIPKRTLYKDWPKNRLVDWKSVIQGTTTQMRRSYALAEMQRLETDLTITDVMMNLGRGGQQMMELLELEEKGSLRRPDGRRMVGTNRSFRIRCVRHQDGSPIVAGEEISWKVAPVTRDELGRPLTTKMMRSMARRGEPLELRNAAIVDHNSCVTVGFTDASLLLNRHGFDTSAYREKERGVDRYSWLYYEEPLWLVQPDESTVQDPRRGPGRPRGQRPNSDGGQAIDS
jgi:hypothetical protein